jgi:hypothetical protein
MFLKLQRKPKLAKWVTTQRTIQVAPEGKTSSTTSESRHLKAWVRMEPRNLGRPLDELAAESTGTAMFLQTTTKRKTPSWLMGLEPKEQYSCNEGKTSTHDLRIQELV